MAVGAATLRSKSQRLGLAISKLDGRAIEWALTCDVSINAAFFTWVALKRQMSRVFALPN